MNVGVVSFFMFNVPLEVPTAQRLVVEKFLPKGAHFTQILTNKHHAESVDRFFRNSNYDIFILLDVDCIPLSAKAFEFLIEKASKGILTGVVQRSNHIENNGHLFVAPSAMAISGKMYQELGKPSFYPTQRGDVGEELTYLCEAKKLPFEWLMPTKTEGPLIWDLKDGIKYGRCTTFGDLFWHAFEGHMAEQQPRFIQKCLTILQPDIKIPA